MPVSPLVLECASFRAVNQLAFRSRTELDFRHRAVHRLGVRLIPRSSRSILLRMFAVYKCAGHVADRDRRAEKGAADYWGRRLPGRLVWEEGGADIHPDIHYTNFTPLT